MLTLQLFINGLSLGAAYALCALGFVLVLNATNAVNFAQGDMVSAGGLAAVALAVLIPAPGFILLPLVLVLAAALGLVASLVAYFPLKNRPAVSVFISTIALATVIQNVGLALAGPEPRAGPPLIGVQTIRIGAIVVSAQALSVIAAAALISCGLALLLGRTKLGRRLRATAQDREMAQALGIDVNLMIALTFMLAAALGGAAGLLLANIYFVTPSDGTAYILKAYIAATIGGWGRIGGAAAGALLIALFEVIFPSLPLIVPGLAALPGAEAIFSQTSAAVALYGALLAILVVRPQGLFGEVYQRRA
jgi:branched-chain amino acid transport system permease protein